MVIGGRVKGGVKGGRVKGGDGGRRGRGIRIVLRSYGPIEAIPNTEGVGLRVWLGGGVGLRGWG